MLNLGLSGGMDPMVQTGNSTLGLGFCASSLYAKWGFAVGCRRPIGVDIANAIPSFPWVVTGHEGTLYDAVSLFILWLPHVPASTRTLWVDVGRGDLVMPVFASVFQS